MTEQEKIKRDKDRLIAKYAGRKSSKNPTGKSSGSDRKAWEKVAARERALSGGSSKPKEKSKSNSGLRVSKPSSARAPSAPTRSRAPAMKAAFVSSIRNRLRG